tara:strand:- start:684 stop:1175 length:492 start_codon:yes stop_codon:yes gene_type:complete
MWLLLQNNPKHYGVGTVCEVWINEDKGLIKRYFKPDGITVSGKPVGPENPPWRVKELFENEKYWLEKLKSKWIPETVEIGDNYIIQKYYGPVIGKEYRKWKEQEKELLEFYKNNNCNKTNHNAFSMTSNGNQLIGFDFKHALKIKGKQLIGYKHNGVWYDKHN